LEVSAHKMRGKKIGLTDINIAEGRCMLRVMIYDGEVCASPETRVV
jgi:hypothetical protein